jgi:hypothetical protein
MLINAHGEYNRRPLKIKNSDIDVANRKTKSILLNRTHKSLLTFCSARAVALRKAFKSMLFVFLRPILLLYLFYAIT